MCIKYMRNPNSCIYGTYDECFANVSYYLVTVLFIIYLHTIVAVGTNEFYN